MKRTIVLHPFLFAAFPVLSLYSHNIEQASLSQTFMPLGVSLALAGLVLLLSRMLTGNYREAGVIASVFLVLFFSYGHVYLFFKGIWPTRYIFVGAGLLLVWSAAIVVVAILTRRTPKRLDKLTVVLNLVSIILVAALLVRIGVYEFRASSGMSAAGRSEIEDLSSVETACSDSLPDIYYIIMDRYPSQSTLQDVYGFDNSEFMGFLRSRGFYVATESRCNYARTDMSLASSLNMEYVNDAVEKAGSESYRRMLYARMQDHRVWRFLKSRGYRFVHFGTWWGSTSHNRYADENVNRLMLSEFATILFRTTMVYPISAALGFDSHREQWRRALYKFDKLAEMPEAESPVFVFAHFLLPHEPYVFDRNGAFVARFKQIRKGTKAGFVDQLAFTNTKLRWLIDRLLVESGTPPIIILQADEGPHPPENFESIDEVSDLRARFRILNAYDLPRTDSSAWYPSITPVNSFRVVFNHCFGTDLELVPDTSYDYVGGRFADITDVVRYD
jgi:hypothetical protein